ncbi:hypothetical protein GCM10009527_036120 [Actinomadura nitritigenes]
MPSKGPEPRRVPGLLAGQKRGQGRGRTADLPLFSYGNTPTGEASAEAERLSACIRGWCWCLLLLSPLLSVFASQATLMEWGPTLTVMSTCPPRALA